MNMDFSLALNFKEYNFAVWQKYIYLTKRYAQVSEICKYNFPLLILIYVSEKTKTRRLSSRVNHLKVHMVISSDRMCNICILRYVRLNKGMINEQVLY